MRAAWTRMRRSLTLGGRALLILLLLAQLGVLWVVAHASPTHLPAGVLGVLGELVAGRMDFECREATIDQRGRIRLGGVRLNDSLHPDDAILGDFDLLPDWRSCLLGEPRIIALHVRGRARVGEPDSAGRIDDFVVRLGLAPTGGRVDLQAGARIGPMALRAHMLEDPGYGQAGPETDALAWDRGLAAECLRLLRSLEGAVAVSMTGDDIAVEGGFADNPAALSPWPVRIGQGRLLANRGGRKASAVLTGLRIGDGLVERAWVQLDDHQGLQVLADGVRIGGSRPAGINASGRWHPGDIASLRLAGETSGSRVSAELEVGLGQVRLRDGSARLAAQDLAIIAPLAQRARAAGVGLVGVIEFLGVEANWSRGVLTDVRASFAFADTGWADIRPALVRPEQSRPNFQGELRVDLARNRLEMTELDLAGIRGEIRGGLGLGDEFQVRLASSQGQPVNPSCLDTLLGAWWIDLWSRIDLSTHRTRPDAEVCVLGRWGHPESIRTTVRATLRGFGLMGARFSEADVWVFAQPDSTLVRIDQLRGELDGAPAGAARGTLRWDWRRATRRGEPQMDLEGDLDPRVGLRMLNPATAAKLRAWDFGGAIIRLAAGPGRPMLLQLESPRTANIGGMRIDRLRLAASQGTDGGDLTIIAKGEVCGAKVSARLAGDLASRNQVQVTIQDWSRSGVEALVEQLGGASAGKPAEPVAKAGKDHSRLSLSYAGTLDLAAPLATEGTGQLSLIDPNLKTIRLLGPLSKAFDIIGVSFSNYNLERVNSAFSCAKGRIDVTRLDIEGDGAAINLKGTLGLETGALNLAGGLSLKDSPWGPLKYLNPNRLIASMISLRVGGTVAKPDVRAEITKLNPLK